MNTAIMNIPTAQKLSYADFQGFDALKNNTQQLNELINLYREVFAEPVGWNEEYSYEEVMTNLSNELDVNAQLRLCLDREKQDEVVGFCWAQLLSLTDICETVKSVQHYQAIGCPDIFTPLKQLLGDQPMVYLHDLGIKRELRGKLSLNKLIYPVLEDVVMQTGVNKVFFWTIAETNVSKLAKRAGFELVLLHSGMQCYTGEITL